MFKRCNIVIVVIVCSLLVGCSSWTVISPAEAPSVLEIGDTVRVVEKSGTRHEFRVKELTAAGEIVGEDLAFSIDDLALIERSDLDVGYSGLGFVGPMLAMMLIMGGASLIIIIAVIGF